MAAEAGAEAAGAVACGQLLGRDVVGLERKERPPECANGAGHAEEREHDRACLARPGVRQFAHLVAHQALRQAGQVARQRVGPAARHGLRQAGQRCAGAPGQPGCQQQRQRHGTEPAAQQPREKGLAQWPHHELLAHLGHQQAAVGVQPQQVEVPAAVAFELVVAGPRGAPARQVGGQALALRVQADEGQRRYGPGAMGAAVQALPIGFGAQRGDEELVFHRVDDSSARPPNSAPTSTA
jgi:hypothetical protein